MENLLPYTMGSPVYPGEYIPLVSESDFNTSGAHAYGWKMNIPKVTITEQADSYKVEVPIPGIKRENLLLKLFGNVLSIFVNTYEKKVDKPKESGISGSKSKLRFSHKITLPNDADPLFVSAEYRTGTLQLFFLKTAHPFKRISTKIAVY